MKKTHIFVATILALCFVLSGCGNSRSAIKEPDVSQIRSICNLATLECYYHNVAKSEKTGEGFLQKDREFWIEYTGIAKIGIDMSDVTMDIKGDSITVTIPSAKLLSIDICEEDLTEDSYIMSDDGLRKNKITADDQTAAISSAQEEMAEDVKNNKALLLSAQNRAQKLIEEYIEKCGKIVGIQYQIEWEYAQ